MGIMQKIVWLELQDMTNLMYTIYAVNTSWSRSLNRFVEKSVNECRHQTTICKVLVSQIFKLI